MKNLLIYCFSMFILFSCSSPYSEVDNMSWLVGKWISKVQGNNFLESWIRTNDSTWTGQSEFIKDGKLLFSEEMTITKRNNIFYFISSSNDQNEGKPVKFIAKEVTMDKVVFENLQHDFPQQITYVKNHKDSILAYISGDLDGKNERVNFRMSKAK